MSFASRASTAGGTELRRLAGSVVVTRHGARRRCFPQKRRYWVQGTVTTEAAIQMNRGTNLLIALGDDVGAGAGACAFRSARW